MSTLENASLLLNMSINYIQYGYLHLSIFHVVKTFIIIIPFNSWRVFHHKNIPYFFGLNPQLLAIYIISSFLLFNLMLPSIFTHLIFP